MTIIQRGQLIRDDSNYPVGWRYSHITDTTTTVIKEGPAIIHSVIIGSPTQNAVITIYDGVDDSGEVVAVMTTAANILPRSVLINISLEVGLTVVTTTASQDITITYV